ncbi:hypothetical protein M3B90_00800 [Dermabacter sp. p3-SID358]|uniref:hypothetical protein n=1 Tax=Dermabacter sp. p3-SID358 TaxID=2916114 RepID=UPI0021A319C1|nr:hypothetical protein [Dermabacter sp. p3-SID358]MCT1866072.1 hypothetical protein [Dermabacter sp. p3-SID358]
MASRFNPPPSWPEPPEGTGDLPASWQPDPRWPEVPAGWRLDFDPATVGPSPAVKAPVSRSEGLRASAVVSERPGEYPASVELPGHVEPVDISSSHSNGFAQEKPRALSAYDPRARRRKLVVNLCLCLVGVLLVAAAVYGFSELYSYAMNELPKGERAAAAALFSTASPIVHAH